MSISSYLQTYLQKLQKPFSSGIKFKIVEIDQTFLLFIVGLFLGILVFWSKKSLFVFGLFLAFIIFVIIHDFIQIKVAEFFSLRIRKYIIYPFGTKKFYGEDFDSPKHEFIYALSGLAVYAALSVGSAVLGATYLKFLWPETVLLQNTLTAQTFDFALMNFPLFFLFWIGFLLFALNLLIFAMPMDGGRLVKSILTMIFGKFSANNMIPYISKIVALIVILGGLFFWDLLIVIFGLYIYYTTVKELREYDVVRILEGKTIGSFTKKTELLFKAEDSVSDVFREMKKALIPEAIVNFGEGIYGVVDVEGIANVNKSYWPATKVGDIAIKVDPITERENLGFVAHYMVDKDLAIVPVVEGKQRELKGIIKRADFSDYIKIHKIFK